MSLVEKYTLTIRKETQSKTFKVELISLKVKFIVRVHVYVNLSLFLALSLSRLSQMLFFLGKKERRRTESSNNINRPQNDGKNWEKQLIYEVPVHNYT